MKNFGVFSLAVLLSGCSRFNTNPATDIPTPREQICRELKRNIIFNTTSGPTMGAASITQKAEMYHLYDKYNCDKLDKKS